MWRIWILNSAHGNSDWCPFPFPVKLLRTKTADTVIKKIEPVVREILDEIGIGESAKNK